MPYIQVDLDAVYDAQLAGRAVGIEHDVMLGRLNFLWAYCYKHKTDAVSRVVLSGIFPGLSDALLEALVAFRFIEPIGADGKLFRIRGAGRYVKARIARSNSGHAHKGNLIPGGRHVMRSKGHPRGSREEPQSEFAILSGLDPISNIQDPKSNIPLTTAGTEKPEPADACESSPPPTDKSDKTPRPSDVLCADFLEITGKPYVWQGAKDGVALAELCKSVPFDEVHRRWRIGLRADGWPHVATISQLKSKFNDLGAYSPIKKRDWRAQVQEEMNPADASF